jgi:predicted HTH transcriptional regulator
MLGALEVLSMADVAELEQVILSSLGENEQMSKKDFNKIVEIDSAYMASTLRKLIREGRIVSGSDGSTRVYRLVR